jgi:demethylmenaquinone methyltransferase/2-methoxy-6-polyprenyl-1,4-benzoquinol methylase
LNKPVFYFLEVLLQEKLEKSEKLLDVGTGPGHFPIILGESFPNLQIFGIDPSPDMISEAKRNVLKSGLKNVEIRYGDVHNLEFEDEYFDVVTSNFSIKHWKDREKGLSEIYRVLKKDGVVWIVEIEKNADGRKFDELFSVISPEFRIILFPILRYFATRNGVSADELNSYAEKIGFKGSFRASHHLPAVYAILRK